MDRDQLRALATVHALGYRRFKLIDQHTFLEMERKYALRHRMIRKLRSVSGRVGLAKTRDPEWRFTMHSSGPFGEDTNGHWCSYERVRGQWERFIRLHPSRKEQPGWYDCHAAM
jgi:hypothetical protein